MNYRSATLMGSSLHIFLLEKVCDCSDCVDRKFYCSVNIVNSESRFHAKIVRAELTLEDMLDACESLRLSANQ